MSGLAILIPAYNAAETIGATLESLRAQGRALDAVSEVCIADDCSTDATVQRALEVWQDTAPLRVMRAERNMGQHPNVNRALVSLHEIADWVALVHADDIVKSDWLMTLQREIDNADASVASICTSWDSVFADGRIERGEESAQESRIIGGSPRTVRDTLLNGCWWHISGCAIRLSAFADVGSFDPRTPYMGDWDWLLRCLDRGWSVKYVPRSLVLYRLHAGSVAALSLQRSLDISESLRIVRRFAARLSLFELLRFHTCRARFAVRRIFRAVQRCQPLRLGHELETLLLIWKNFGGCLAER